MSWQGQWEGQWQGKWDGSIEVNPNAMYGTAVGTSSVSGTLTAVSQIPEETPVRGGAVSRSKAPRRRVIVEVDGKEYIVPIEGLQEFLDAVSQKVETAVEVAHKPRKKARKQKVTHTPVVSTPVVKIVSAPVEEISLIQKHIDRTNEIMRQVMEGALQRYLNELDDEETLLWLIG